MDASFAAELRAHEVWSKYMILQRFQRELTETTHKAAAATTSPTNPQNGTNNNSNQQSIQTFPLDDILLGCSSDLDIAAKRITVSTLNAPGTDGALMENFLETVSSSIFLGYLLESLLMKEKHSVVSKLKLDARYTIQRVSNMRILLDIVVRELKVDLMTEKGNITAEALVEQKPFFVNEFFWRLFQTAVLQPVAFNGKTGEVALLDWCNSVVQFYPLMKVQGFDKGFNNGLGFSYITHFFSPDKISLSSLSKNNAEHNARVAFETNYQLFGIPPVIDPTRLSTNKNSRIIIIYVALIYRYFSPKKKSSILARQASRVLRFKIRNEAMKQQYIEHANAFLSYVASIEQEMDCSFEANEVQIEEKEEKRKLFVDQERNALHTLLVGVKHIFLELRVRTEAHQRTPFLPKNHLALESISARWRSLTETDAKLSNAIINKRAELSVSNYISTRFTQAATNLREWGQSIYDQMDRLASEIAAEGDVDRFQSKYTEIVEVSLDIASKRALHEEVRLLYLRLQKMHAKERAHQQMIQMKEQTSGDDDRSVVTDLSEASYDKGLERISRQLDDIWTSVVKKSEDLYPEFEKRLCAEITAEQLRLKFSLLADDFALSIASAMLQFQAPYMDYNLLKEMMEEVDTSMAVRTKRLDELLTLERRIQELSSKENEHTEVTAADLARFYEDFRVLKIRKDAQLSDMESENNLRRTYTELSSTLDKWLLRTCAALAQLTETTDEHELRNTLKILNKLKKEEAEHEQYVKKLQSISEFFQNKAAEEGAMEDAEWVFQFPYKGLLDRWSATISIIDEKKVRVEQKISDIVQVIDIKQSLQSEMKSLNRYLIQAIEDLKGAFAKKKGRLNVKNHIKHFIERCSILANILHLFPAAMRPVIQEAERNYLAKELQGIVEHLSSLLKEIFKVVDLFNNTGMELEGSDQDYTPNNFREERDDIMHWLLDCKTIISELVNFDSVFSVSERIGRSSVYIEEIEDAQDGKQPQPRLDDKAMEMLEDQARKIVTTMKATVAALFSSDGDNEEQAVDQDTYDANRQLMPACKRYFRTNCNQMVQKFIERCVKLQEKVDNFVKLSNSEAGNGSALPLARRAEIVSGLRSNFHHISVFYDFILATTITTTGNDNSHELSDDDARSDHSASMIAQIDPDLLKNAQILFEALDLGIQRLREELKVEVLRHIKENEIRMRYRELASAFIAAMDLEREVLTNSYDLTTEKGLEGLKRIHADSDIRMQKLKLNFEVLLDLTEKLKTLSDERVDFGEYTIESITQQFKQLQELAHYIEAEIQMAESKVQYLSTLSQWIKKQIALCREWMDQTQILCAKVPELNALEEIEITKRRAEHVNQERMVYEKLLEQVAQKIGLLKTEGYGNLTAEDERDMRLLQLRWTELMPSLDQLGPSLERLTKEIDMRHKFELRLQQSIREVRYLIALLQSKRVKRPAKEILRATSLQVLEASLGDCKLLQQSANDIDDDFSDELKFEQQFGFKLNFNTDQTVRRAASVPKCIEEKDAILKSLIEELKYQKLQFSETFQSVTEHLNEIIAAQVELETAYNEYVSKSALFMDTMTGERDILVLSTTLEEDKAATASYYKQRMQENEITYTELSALHKTHLLQFPEPIPFEVISQRWQSLKKLYNQKIEQLNIKAENGKKADDLKFKLLEVVKDLSSWLDQAQASLNFQKFRLSNSSNDADLINMPISKMQMILQTITSFEVQRDTQYSKLVQAVNLNMQIILLGDYNQDTEKIVQTLEKKWLNWIQGCQRTRRMLEAAIDRVTLITQRKKQLDALVPELQHWMKECKSALKGVPASDSSTNSIRESQQRPASITNHNTIVNKYELDFWKKQKESKLALLHHIVSISDELSRLLPPDDTKISDTIQIIRDEWLWLEDLFRSKENELQYSSEYMNQQRSKHDQYAHQEQKLLSFMSNCRQSLSQLFQRYSHNARTSNAPTADDSNESPLDRIEAEMMDVLPLVNELRRVEGLHESIESHWNSLVFLLDNVRQSAAEQSRASRDRNDQSTLAESKHELIATQLSQCMQAVHSLLFQTVDCSSRSPNAAQPPTAESENLELAFEASNPLDNASSEVMEKVLLSLFEIYAQMQVHVGGIFAVSVEDWRRITPISPIAAMGKKRGMYVGNGHLSTSLPLRKGANGGGFEPIPQVAILDDNQLKKIESTCCEAFKAFEEVFMQFTQSLSQRIGLEVTLGTYAAALQNIMTWVNTKRHQFGGTKSKRKKKKKSLAVVETPSDAGMSDVAAQQIRQTNASQEHARLIASRYQFYEYELEKSSLLNSQFQDLSLLWSQISAAGVDAVPTIPSPKDVKDRIDELDQLVAQRKERCTALNTQLSSVTSVRGQLLETALNLSILLSRHDIPDLINMPVRQSPKFFDAHMEQIKVLKDREQQATTTIEFLEDLKSSIQEQDMDTSRIIRNVVEQPESSSVSDPLGTILLKLRDDLSLLQIAIAAKHMFVQKRIQDSQDMERLQSESIETLKDINSYLSKCRLEHKRLNQDTEKAQFEEALRIFKDEHSEKSLTLCRLLFIQDRIQQLSGVKTAVPLLATHDIVSRWKGITNQLDEAERYLTSLKESGIYTSGFERGTSLFNIVNIDLWMDSVYLKIWTSDSLGDIDSLLAQATIPRQTVQDIAFDFALLHQELLLNDVHFGKCKESLSLSSRENSSEATTLQHVEELLRRLKDSIPALQERLVAMSIAHLKHSYKVGRMNHIAAIIKSFLDNKKQPAKDDERAKKELLRDFNFYKELHIELADNVDFFSADEEPKQFTREAIVALDSQMRDLSRTLHRGVDIISAPSVGGERSAVSLSSQTAVTRNDTPFQYFVEKLRQSYHRTIELFVRISACELPSQSCEGLHHTVDQINKECKELVTRHISELNNMINNELDAFNKSFCLEPLQLLEELASKLELAISAKMEQINLCKEQIAVLADIRKQYNSEAAEMHQSLQELRDLIERKRNGEDIRRELNLATSGSQLLDNIYRNMNPKVYDFSPQSPIATLFERKALGGDELVRNEFDVLYTLREEVYVEESTFSALCLIQLRMLNAGTKMRVSKAKQIEDKEEYSLANLSAEWNKLCDDCSALIENFRKQIGEELVHAMSSSLGTNSPTTTAPATARSNAAIILKRSIANEFHDLEKWYRSASEFVSNFERGGSLCEMQIALMSLNMFKLRFDHYDARYKLLLEIISRRDGGRGGAAGAATPTANDDAGSNNGSESEDDERLSALSRLRSKVINSCPFDITGMHSHSGGSASGDGVVMLLPTIESLQDDINRAKVLERAHLRYAECAETTWSWLNILTNKFKQIKSDMNFGYIGAWENRYINMQIAHTLLRYGLSDRIPKTRQLIEGLKACAHEAELLHRPSGNNNNNNEFSGEFVCTKYTKHTAQELETMASKLEQHISDIEREQHEKLQQFERSDRLCLEYALRVNRCVEWIDESMLFLEEKFKVESMSILKRLIECCEDWKKDLETKWEPELASLEAFAIEYHSNNSSSNNQRNNNNNNNNNEQFHQGNDGGRELACYALMDIDSLKRRFAEMRRVGTERLADLQNRVRQRIAIEDKFGMSQEQLEESEEIFRHFDQDHSNALDQDEIKLAMETLGCTMADIAMADKDNSGTIDFDEFIALLRRGTSFKWVETQEDLAELLRSILSSSSAQSPNSNNNNNNNSDDANTSSNGKNTTTAMTITWKNIVEELGSSLSVFELEQLGIIFKRLSSSSSSSLSTSTVTADDDEAQSHDAEQPQPNEQVELARLVKTIFD